jgi:hypothetical protein
MSERQKIFLGITAPAFEEKQKVPDFPLHRLGGGLNLVDNRLCKWTAVGSGLYFINHEREWLAGQSVGFEFKNKLKK